MTSRTTYRDSEYFDPMSTYLFESPLGSFESKVHFEKGHWWTNESLNYKATALRCRKV